MARSNPIATLTRIASERVIVLDEKWPAQGNSAGVMTCAKQGIVP